MTTAPTHHRPRGTVRIRTLQSLAPATALLLVAGLPRLLPTTLADRPEDQAARARVVAAVKDAPWIVDGRWTATEIPVPPSAVELLRPNAILSRRFVDVSSGRALQLILVHSNDVRDTQGHYPPICYPANGWRPAGDDEQALRLPGLGPVPVRHYRFDRSGVAGTRQGIHVLNVFLLPDGGTTTSMAEVGRIAGRRAVAGRGVAQLQVVADDTMTLEQLRRDAETVLAGFDDLLTSVRRSEE